MDTDDRIERTIDLRASRARVWRAISTPGEFGAWFGLGDDLVLDGAFVPGARIDGVWTIAGKTVRELFCTIEEVVPEQLLAFRWVPYEVPAGDDPAQHPTTRIEMRLEETPGGTRLTISEAGFARLPPDKQYKRGENAQGWTGQLQAIAGHLLGRITVSVEQRIARPIAEVYEAIVDPAQLARYFVSRSSGRMVAGARLVWAWSDAGAQHDVAVHVAEAPRHLMFSWTAAGHPTKVILELAPDGDGATKLVAGEAPFPLTEEAAARAVRQTQGWTHFACCLKALVEHGLDLRGPRVA
ncbi:MAG: SRPBCC domain-containing protein [Deltaproteobacteria bacterium]|nr:SRPBCC domain-containing protein [Deltaproteobacteria bacterium]